MTNTPAIVSANTLKLLRARSGLSQAALASAACLSVRTVRMLEGDQPPRPRRGTLLRLLSALPATSEELAEVLSAWGYEVRPRVVAPQQMMPRNDFAKVAPRLRASMARYVTVFAKTSGQIDDGRIVVRERTERVVRAVVPGVASVPYVIVWDSRAAMGSANVTTFDGCTIASSERFPDQNITVFDVALGTTLAVGEARSIGIDMTFSPDAETGRAHAHQLTTSPDAFGGRIISAGVHAGAKLVILKVRFRLDVRPARCFAVYENSLNQGYEDKGTVRVSDGGTAEIVLVDPVAGWHGLVWEW